MASDRRSLLNPKRPVDLCDTEGRLLCFTGSDKLKDWTLNRCRAALESIVPSIRAYILGALMEHARPDDVLQWVSPLQILDDWPLARERLETWKRRDHWSLIVRRLHRLHFGFEYPPAARRPAGRQGKAVRELSLAFLMLGKPERAGILGAVRLALDEGADLVNALHLAQSAKPEFSVFELVEILMRLDFRLLPGGMGLDAGTLERWSQQRDQLAEELLDLVLAPLVVRH